MSHEVETAYYADTPAWHGVGTVVKDARTSAEAMTLAGLDWDVKLGPLYGGLTVDSLTEVEGKRAVVRETDGRVLGTCSAKYYEPWQNSEAFEFMDSLLQDGQLTYQAAGSLKKGRNIWLLAQLTEGMKVGADEYQRYLLLTAGHDAGVGIQLLPTDVCVVCWNTQSYALSQGRAKLTSISHTRAMHNRLDAARDALELTTEASRKRQERLQVWSDTQVDDEIELIVERALFGEDVEKRSTNIKNKADIYGDILDWERNRLGQTAYAVSQAVTGFADHQRVPSIYSKKGDLVQARAERRMRSVMSGSSARFKERGLTALVGAIAPEEEGAV